jgi:hypothetical protein
MSAHAAVRARGPPGPTATSPASRWSDTASMSTTTPPDQPGTWRQTPSSPARTRWDEAARTLPHTGHLWMQLVCAGVDRGDRLLRMLSEVLDELSAREPASADQFREGLRSGRLCLKGADDEVAWSDTQCILFDGHASDCLTYVRGHARGDYVLGADRPEAVDGSVRGARTAAAEPPTCPAPQ